MTDIIICYTASVTTSYMLRSSDQNSDTLMFIKFACIVVLFILQPFTRVGVRHWQFQKLIRQGCQHTRTWAGMISNL